jgi:hypothetical protein
MKKTLCHEVNIPAAYPVQLYQTGLNRFTVVYGRQVKAGLTYTDAAKEFGYCVFHALACASLLDNRKCEER